MVSRIRHLTVDCRDAYALSTWWKQVLGYRDVDDDPNESGDPECLIVDDADANHAALPSSGMVAATRKPPPGRGPACSVP